MGIFDPAPPPYFAADGTINNAKFLDKYGNPIQGAQNVPLSNLNWGPAYGREAPMPQPMAVTPPQMTTLNGTQSPMANNSILPQQQTDPNAGGWLSQLQQQLGGSATGGMDWSSLGPTLMALGGGIAAGSGHGWGAGIGQGLEGATAIQQKRLELAKTLALAQQEMQLRRYHFATGPNGQPLVWDALNPPKSGTFPLQNFGGQQPQAAPVAPSGPTSQDVPVAQSAPQTPNQVAAAPSAPNAMAMTNSGVSAITGYTGEETKRAQAASQAGTKANAQLDTLTTALNALPDKNDPNLSRRYLIAGSGEEARAAQAASANTAADIAGLPRPFSGEDVSNLQLANKESKQAGLTQGRQLYGASREGQQTIQTLLKIQPNEEQTPLGFRKIVAYNRSLNQRDIDYADFLQNWIQNPSHPGDATGALQAFDKARPPSFYAQQAQKEIGQYGDTGSLSKSETDSKSLSAAKAAIAANPAARMAIINKVVKAGLNPTGL